MMWGATSPSAKLTGDSGSVFEALMIAIVACFVLWRKISRCAFWDFCNNICQTGTRCIAAALALCGTN